MIANKQPLLCLNCSVIILRNILMYSNSKFSPIKIDSNISYVKGMHNTSITDGQM